MCINSQLREKVKKYFVSSMALIVVVCILVLLFGCTYTFSNITTVGRAQDVVDSTPTTETEVNPNITVPVSPL